MHVHVRYTSGRETGRAARGRLNRENTAPARCEVSSQVKFKSQCHPSIRQTVRQAAAWLGSQNHPDGQTLPHSRSTADSQQRKFCQLRIGLVEPGVFVHADREATPLALNRGNDHVRGQRVPMALPGHQWRAVGEDDDHAEQDRCAFHMHAIRERLYMHMSMYMHMYMTCTCTYMYMCMCMCM